MFLFFFYYSNTFTRIGVIFTGVLIAYACVFTSFPHWLKARRFAADFLWLLCGCVLTCQLLWSRWFANGNVVETPGFSAIFLAKQQPLFSFNYLHHFLYYTLAVVGGPLSGLMFGYIVMAITHSLGTLGPIAHRVLSKPFWIPIADASFFAYLMHPIVMVKSYITIFYPPQIGFGHVIMHYLFHAVVTLSVSYALHLIVEKPIEKWLRSPPSASTTAVSSATTTFNSSAKPSSGTAPGGDYEHPQIARFVFYYCCAAIIFSIGHHAIQTPIVMSLWDLKPSEAVITAN